MKMATMRNEPEASATAWHGQRGINTCYSKHPRFFGIFAQKILILPILFNFEFSFETIGNNNKVFKKTTYFSRPNKSQNKHFSFGWAARRVGPQFMLNFFHEKFQGRPKTKGNLRHNVSISEPWQERRHVFTHKQLFYHFWHHHFPLKYQKCTKLIYYVWAWGMRDGILPPFWIKCRLLLYQ